MVCVAPQLLSYLRELTSVLGLSDPYVKIKHEGCAGGKWTSEVCPKTLNPRWTEGTCELCVVVRLC